MSTTTSAGVATPTGSRATALRAWLLWTSSFLLFPVAGVVGTALAGRVDGPLPALLGGAGAGAVLGLGQALLSSGRLSPTRWTAATSLGTGVGLLVGAHGVQYATTTGALAVMGALSGLVLGAVQALALPSRTRSPWAWAMAMPAVWALGWSVSALVLGNSVHQQFTLFGASGAVIASALLGLLLHGLLPASPAARHTPHGTATTGESS
jgi:hypothetical protein